MTRAFVVGATGYVGREVVRILCEEGVETTAHVRPQSRDKWVERFASVGAVLDSSAWEPAKLSSALAAAKPDLVFSLLGTTRRAARAEAIGGDIYDKIDYGLTAMLYEAASTLEKPPRFVYLSAVGVSDSSRTAYMKARVKAEAMIRSGSLPFVIARPAIISGTDRDESRRGEYIGGKILDGALSVIGALGAKRTRERYRSTTATVLAAALVRLATESTEAAVIAEGADLR